MPLRRRPSPLPLEQTMSSPPSSPSPQMVTAPSSPTQEPVGIVKPHFVHFPPEPPLDPTQVNGTISPLVGGTPTEVDSSLLASPKALLWRSKASGARAAEMNSVFGKAAAAATTPFKPVLPHSGTQALSPLRQPGSGRDSMDSTTTDNPSGDGSDDADLGYVSDQSADIGGNSTDTDISAPFTLEDSLISEDGQRLLPSLQSSANGSPGSPRSLASAHISELDAHQPPVSPLPGALLPELARSQVPTPIDSPRPTSRVRLAGYGPPPNTPAVPSGGGAVTPPYRPPSPGPAWVSSASHARQTQGQGRKVSATMSFATREHPASEIAGSQHGYERHDIIPLHTGQATHGSQPGTPPLFEGDLRPDTDDEWAAYVRLQLARLFPDVHAELVEQPTDKQENEGLHPNFREEIVALRQEIGMLRGVVAELAGQLRVEQAQKMQDVRLDLAPRGRLDTESTTPTVLKSQAEEDEQDVPIPTTPAALKAPPPTPLSLQRPVVTGQSSGPAPCPDGITILRCGAPPLHLSPGELDRVLGVVRAVDAAHHRGRNTDQDVFNEDNLGALAGYARELAQASGVLE